MTSALRVLVVLLVAFASIGSFGPDFNPPEADTCPEPSAGMVDSVEVGGSDADSFVPLVDGQVVELTSGGQGASMFGVRFRLRGSSVPECVAQYSSIHRCIEPGSCQDEIARSTASLRTYAESDGSRTTRIHWLILDSYPLDWGAPFELRTQVAGRSVTMSFWHGVQADAASPDPDAASPDPDAASPDAIAPDAETPPDATP